MKTELRDLKTCLKFNLIPFVSSSSAIVGIILIGQVSNVVKLALVGKTLGTDAQAGYSWAVAAITFVSLFIITFVAGLTAQFAQLHASGKSHLIGRKLNLSILFTFIAGLVIAIALFFVQSPLQKLFGLSRRAQVHANLYYPMALLSVPLNMLIVLFSSLWFGLHKAYIQLLITAFFSMIDLLACAYAIRVLHYSIRSIAVINFFIFISGNVTNCILLYGRSSMRNSLSLLEIGFDNVQNDQIANQQRQPTRISASTELSTDDSDGLIGLTSSTDELYDEPLPTQTFNDDSPSLEASVVKPESLSSFTFDSLYMLARGILIMATLFLPSVIASRFGTVNLAAYSIVFGLLSFSPLLSTSLGTASNAQASKFLGQNDYKSLKFLSILMPSIGLVLGLLLSLLFTILKMPLIKAFTNDPKVIEITSNSWWALILDVLISGPLIVTEGLALARQWFRFLWWVTFGAFFVAFLPLALGSLYKWKTVTSLLVSLILLASIRFVAVVIGVALETWKERNHPTPVSSIYFGNQNANLTQYVELGSLPVSEGDTEETATSPEDLD